MRRSDYKISDFREIVEFYNFSLNTDSAGGSKPNYTLYTTTLARVEPFDGDLFIESGNRVINNKYLFTIRYRSGGLTYGTDNIWENILTNWSDDTGSIDKKFKIKYRGDNYVIHSVRLDDEKRYYIRIVAWKRN
jgi:hypothetical protein